MQEEISFGTWLRKKRRALDLSQQTFANQVGCAEVTLRRIEVGTLKPSKELANILLERLGISEIERPQWISFARGLSGFPLSSVPSSNKPNTNLPTPLTTFIGRKKEQSEVMQLLAKHRLVTLTGPGGVGKTRLSQKVGEQVLGSYADGVWIVELALILDPLLVPRTTAIAIGLRDEPQRPVIDMLSDYLREKPILIILDNCEHLLESSAQLADMLLKRCPSLKILATSREAFGVLGEAVYPVPSLELPDIQQIVEKFRAYESVRLFEERAQLAQMNFSLTIDNVPSVAQICNKLDGVPLAIELAAARIKTFSVEQIAVRLQENFSLLSAGNRTALPRHQTLQAAIDWSYDLLSSAEQTLFRRLSIFVNGWTLDAAESICSDANIQSETMLDLLSQLINKSLVIVDETQGKTRYRMLETIRQYANEKIVELGESDSLRDKHLEYFLNLAETAEPHLIRPEQLEWLSLLDADYENLRLALEWALSKEIAESSLRLSGALGWFWVIRCYWLEGLNWLVKALAKPAENENKNENVARARALYTRAMLEWQLGNFEQILAPADESLLLAMEVSDRRDIAIAKYFLAGALLARGEDNESTHSLLEQSFTEFQVLNEPFWQTQVFQSLGSFLTASAKSKYSDLLLRSLELARKAGERLTLADALSAYADWLYRTNRVNEAMEYLKDAERLYGQIGVANMSMNLFLVAEIAWSKGDYQKARSLYMSLEQHLSLLGIKFIRSRCIGMLGTLAMDGGDLDQARVYLEEALSLQREFGSKPGIATYLAELSNLFYLQGKPTEFKQNFRDSVALKNSLGKIDRAILIMIIHKSLYSQKPETAACLMGVVDTYERESEFPLKPLEKRYWDRAEAHACRILGDAAFEAAFAEGQKMSLDEGLDLALKAIEEM
jgi:predicted ATPase/tetratricopeptide (TPR) repeat protein/DNA-binding XRE family transcriptional regulator